MKPVWKFFSSVKLAIVLLILIAVASLVGTLIPQGLPPAAYAARYGRLAGLLSAFQLTGLYHSGWYLTLLFFLAANTIVCTLARLPAKWRRAFHPKIETEPSELAAMKNAHRFGKNGPPAEAASRLESVLRSHRYRVLAKPSEKRVSILARKRTAGLFGSDFVHLGLLVIIAGGIVSGLAGFRVQLDLAEGQTAKVPRAPFEIRLDRFETEYYPQGSVKAWKSTLTVIENGAEVRSSLILVNKPLDYKGFSFYQAAYGSTWNNATVEITIKKKSDAAFARAVRPRVGEEAAVDDKDVTRLFVKRFVPDFVIGEGNEVQSRSDEPKNPAALVEGWQGGEKIFSGWLFANFPDFAGTHEGRPSDLVFSLTAFRPSEYSVIEAARDPGAPLIWAGCLLVLAGLFLAFYWPPREIRAVLEEGRERTDIVAAGHAAKNREAFAAELDGIVNSLRRG